MNEQEFRDAVISDLATIKANHNFFTSRLDKLEDSMSFKFLLSVIGGIAGAATAMAKLVGVFR